MTMPKFCMNCMYYRDATGEPHKEYPWCSNSQSEFALLYVLDFDSCRQFVDRDQKAPLTMRLGNKLLAGIGKMLND